MVVSRTRRVRQALYVLLAAAAGAFLLHVMARALWAAFSHDDFPEALAVKVELMPVLFPLHMVTGGLALVLVPAAYALRRQSRLHRWVGRVAAADVLVAGVTAFPVALLAPVTGWSAAGFTAQATVWLVLLAAGIDAVRHRRIARHRACMLLMAATTSGAVFFRLFLGAWAMAGSRRHFETFYACDAWAAWLLPLAGTAMFLARRSRSGQPPVRPAARVDRLGRGRGPRLVLPVAAEPPAL